MFVRCRQFVICLFLLNGLAEMSPAHAQWVTQKIELKAGWNGVFLHVDASYDTLNTLVGSVVSNPILEVWRWNPPSGANYLTASNPAVVPEWSSWLNTDTNSALQRLVGDSAYLVRLSTNIVTHNWNIKGRPVAPRSSWSISGLNLIGFPTVTNAPPNLAAFIARAPELQTVSPEVYAYNGAVLGTNNPALLVPFLFPATTVKRGQAFWMRSGTVFSRYYGPFEFQNFGLDGIDFGDYSASTSFRLKNLSDTNVTVTLRLLASETPPAGQTNIAGVPPLIVRGALNVTNYTYSYTNLPVGASVSWALAPGDANGSEVEVVLGLNRSAITNSPGALLAGVLSLTDSFGHTMVQAPVSALASSRAGLWVGGAEVNQVAHYLKSYERNPDNSPVVSSNGSYAVTNLDTSLGSVGASFPLRLIVHNPEGNTNAVLLHRVYYGVSIYSNTVVANGESVLSPAFLGSARRITSTHLPWSSNNIAWTFSGNLNQSTGVTTTVTVGYNNQAANPFIHTYHPDHDNLNATFNGVVEQGDESYLIHRAITLNIQSPGNDFASLVDYGTKISGQYLETTTLEGLSRGGGSNETRQFNVRGSFELNRLTDIPTLTIAP
jgi:hypothetical protein